MNLFQSCDLKCYQGMKQSLNNIIFNALPHVGSFSPKVLAGIKNVKELITGDDTLGKAVFRMCPYYKTTIDADLSFLFGSNKSIDYWSKIKWIIGICLSYYKFVAEVDIGVKQRQEGDWLYQMMIQAQTENVQFFDQPVLQYPQSLFPDWLLDNANDVYTTPPCSCYMTVTINTGNSLKRFDLHCPLFTLAANALIYDVTLYKLVVDGVELSPEHLKVFIATNAYEDFDETLNAVETSPLKEELEFIYCRMPILDRRVVSKNLLPLDEYNATQCQVMTVQAAN